MTLHIRFRRLVPVLVFRICQLPNPAPPTRKSTMKTEENNIHHNYNTTKFNSILIYLLFNLTVQNNRQKQNTKKKQSNYDNNHNVTTNKANLILKSLGLQSFSTSIFHYNRRQKFANPEQIFRAMNVLGHSTKISSTERKYLNERDSFPCREQIQHTAYTITVRIPHTDEWAGTVPCKYIATCEISLKTRKLYFVRIFPRCMAKFQRCLGKRLHI